ncbi:hypothetical protein E2C01_087278 [Portunus trituberculatus]|uniref:Uncharacterized protein n=1 Tax=Portunus trituberculatus TaxID=210409 RepID=A0A5B7JCW8_PORTR|nr:hypothetical protein [Portunus trituberculatus]
MAVKDLPSTCICLRVDSRKVACLLQCIVGAMLREAAVSTQLHATSRTAVPSPGLSYAPFIESYTSRRILPEWERVPFAPRVIVRGH